MGLYPITINTAPQTEPHIYAQDDASIYQSIFGDDCVFDIGSKFKAQTLSSNKIRLSDGVMQIGGHIARIKYGDYEDVTITNGVSGKKRVTIIAGRFQTTGTIDDMTLVTKDGVAGDTYVDPAINEGDLYQGASIREMLLYRVKLNGINIEAVEQMFRLRKTINALQNLLEIATPIINDTAIVNFKGNSEAIINVSLPSGYLVPICSNGDPAAYPAFIIGAHVMPGNKQIKFKADTNIPGDFRINYAVFKLF